MNTTTVSDTSRTPKIPSQWRVNPENLIVVDSAAVAGAAQAVPEFDLSNQDTEKQSSFPVRDQPQRPE